VHRALESLRQGRPLRGSALLELAALRERLPVAGGPTTVLARERLLSDLLDELTWSELSRRRGSPDAVRSYVPEAVELARLTADFAEGDAQAICEWLEAMADLARAAAQAESQARLAARLLGAAAALRAAVGSPRAPKEQADHDAAVAVALEHAGLADTPPASPTVT
jgi:hypothetical protein